MRHNQNITRPSLRLWLPYLVTVKPFPNIVNQAIAAFSNLLR